MTEREAAIKRFIDAGGVWPPTPAPVTAWVDTGRWRSLCRGCGAPCAHDRRWCEHCSTALP